MIPVLLVWAFAAAPAEPSSQRAKFLTPQVEKTIQAGLKFLASQQLPTGSFSATQYPTGATSIALLAFLANGHTPGRGEYGEVVTKGIDFLLHTVRDPMTGFIGQSMYEHGFATLVLADVFGEYRDKNEILQDALEQAVQLIIQVQDKGGGWRYSPQPTPGDVSVTSANIMGLRAAREAFIHVPAAVMERAARFTKSCATDSGMIAYMPQGRKGQGTPANTGSGSLSLMACGEFDSPEVKGALNWLKSNSHNMQGGHGNYGIYYGTVTMYQAGEPYWSAWMTKIQPVLLKSTGQAGGGGVSGSNVIETAFGVIALSIEKGLLPLFQR